MIRELLSQQLRMANMTLSEFVEISSCVEGPGVCLSESDLLDGCSCLHEPCQTESNPACPCLKFDSAVESGGRLKKEYLSRAGSGPVFLCGVRCTCSLECGNRLQAGVDSCTLKVFDTARKGLGVKTASFIREGTFVCEYVGEIVDEETASHRLGRLKVGDGCYLVVYKEHMASGQIVKTFVDAQFKGNIARLINHSCRPNLAMVPVRNTTPVPRLCLFAARDIAQDEELSFHYGESSGQQKGGPCYCGADECRGFLPFNPI